MDELEVKIEQTQKDYYPDVLGSYIIEYVESLKKNSIC